MKILYVITKADEIGGAQIHIRDLARNLIREGHCVNVIVGESGALVDELKKDDIPVFIVRSLVRQISPSKDFKALVDVRRLIKNISPDIISLHSSKAGIIGRLSSIGLKIPVIFTAHGWAFANGVSKKNQKLYCLIEKIIAPLAHKIITVSEQDKKLALQFNVASDSKQIVIHNGMPQTSLPRRFEINGKDSVINLISVARFSDQKDHKTLFYALANLKDLNWKLKLIGKGPLLPLYQELAIKLKINNRIEFLGERHDVATLLSNSDIFLLISNWEGFPRSILEAMRAGLPVIASNVGGVSESVQHEITGYLIERGNCEELTRRLDILIQNSSLRVDMGRAGYNSFINNFIFDAMYNKTKNVYMSLVQKH